MPALIPAYWKGGCAGNKTRGNALVFYVAIPIYSLLLAIPAGMK